MNSNLMRAVLAEMLGTFILMLCVCGICSMGSVVSLFDCAAMAGLTVVVLTFSIGPISAAHLNPAISVAYATLGHLPWSRVLPYTMAQTTACVMATYAGMFIYAIKSEQLTTRPLHDVVSAFCVEFLGTFIVVFVAASLLYEAQSVGHLSGFVIGMAIVIAVFITGPVSGGSTNPARSLGPAIVSWAFNDIWIYVTAPVIGAVSGALLCSLLRRGVPPPTPPFPNGRLLPRSSSINVSLIH